MAVVRTAMMTPALRSDGREGSAVGRGDMGGASRFVVAGAVAVHFQPVVPSTQRIGVADIGIPTF